MPKGETLRDRRLWLCLLPIHHASPARSAPGSIDDVIGTARQLAEQNKNRQRLSIGAVALPFRERLGMRGLRGCRPIPWCPEVGRTQRAGAGASQFSSESAIDKATPPE
jgi:hypothetical protein